MKFVCETLISKGLNNKSYFLRDENGTLLEVNKEEIDILAKQGHEILNLDYSNHIASRVDMLGVAVQIESHLKKKFVGENMSIQMYQSGNMFTVEVKLCNKVFDDTLFSVQICAFGVKARMAVLYPKVIYHKSVMEYKNREIYATASNTGITSVLDYLDMYFCMGLKCYEKYLEEKK